MTGFLVGSRFEFRWREFFIVVGLLLGDLFLENDDQTMTWRDANSLRNARVLWIIISVKGTCDDKISRSKVSETLKKRPKTRTFELYFARLIDS